MIVASTCLGISAGVNAGVNSPGQNYNAGQIAVSTVRAFPQSSMHPQSELLSLIGITSPDFGRSSEGLYYGCFTVKSQVEKLRRSMHITAP